MIPSVLAVSCVDCRSSPKRKRELYIPKIQIIITQFHIDMLGNGKIFTYNLIDEF